MRARTPYRHSLPWLVTALLVMIPAVAPAKSLLSAGSGPVDIDQELLGGILARSIAEFSLPVDGSEFQVKVESVSDPNLGVTSLKGRLEGSPDSFFLLCRTELGATVAFFQPGNGKAYRMDSKRGRNELYPVDFSRLGPCGGGIGSGEIRKGRETEHPPPALPSPDKTGGVSDDGSRHDILVGYTPAAEAFMGGWDFIRAEAQLAVDAANLTYLNSGIASTLRLVHVMATDYEEISAWEYLDHVNFLWYPDDGKMDEVLVMRDRVGADFVCMLIDGREFDGSVKTCGMAPLMQPDEINHDFEDLAISVVSVQCATANWSLSHEVGHNRGCAHNREDAGVGGAYPYAHGRRFTGTDEAWYHTVMAYGFLSGESTRIPYFSDPGIFYAGFPTGVAPGLVDEAHNVLTHGNTAVVCAGFRPERTFVQFGWAEFSNGFILFPYPDLLQAMSNSRDGGTIVIQNSDPGFTGVLEDPRSFDHDGSGSAVLGGI